MPEPADIIEDVKLDFSIALDSMLKQAAEPINNEEDVRRAKIFISLIEDFYREQKALLGKIAEAGKMVNAKLKAYDNKPKQAVIDDL